MGFDFSMTNLVVSTIAYFVASYFIGRWLEDQGIPRGPSRSLGVFVLALLVSYAVGAAVDWLISLF